MNMNPNENRNSLFETSDFPLAVTLLSLGFPLQQLDSSNPLRAVFCFTQSVTLQKTVDDFWNSKISIEPISFLNNQRALKARIRGGLTL